jgi:hypothetical protein
MKSLLEVIELREKILGSLSLKIGFSVVVGWTCTSIEHFEPRNVPLGWELHCSRAWHLVIKGVFL